MAYDEDLAARVRAALSGLPALEEKRMFGGLCFMLSGHMALGVVKDRLMVRFQPSRHDEVLELPGAGPMTFTKRAAGMRGLAYVSQDGLPDETALATWVELALELVRSLPPKSSSQRNRKAKTPVAKSAAAKTAAAKAPAAKASARPRRPRA
ncbi:MAG: TfoX/Sxy family protein [Myxococcota bacterium]